MNARSNVILATMLAMISTSGYSNAELAYDDELGDVKQDNKINAPNLNNATGGTGSSTSGSSTSSPGSSGNSTNTATNDKSVSENNSSDKVLSCFKQNNKYLACEFYTKIKNNYKLRKDDVIVLPNNRTINQPSDLRMLNIGAEAGFKAGIKLAKKDLVMNIGVAKSWLDFDSDYTAEAPTNTGNRKAINAGYFFKVFSIGIGKGEYVVQSNEDYLNSQKNLAPAKEKTLKEQLKGLKIYKTKAFPTIPIEIIPPVLSLDLKSGVFGHIGFSVAPNLSKLLNPSDCNVGAEAKIKGAVGAYLDAVLDATIVRGGVEADFELIGAEVALIMTQNLNQYYNKGEYAVRISKPNVVVTAFLDRIGAEYKRCCSIKKIWKRVASLELYNLAKEREDNFLNDTTPKQLWNRSVKKL